MTTDRSLCPSIVALFGSRSFFGAERANVDLLKMMKESGARVTCLVRDEDWPENFELRCFLEDHGLEWRACPFASYPSWRYWRYWPQVVIENLRAITIGNRRLKQICWEVEATHIHSFNPFLTFSFWPALNALRVPLIYRCGDYPTHHNLFYRIIWRWLLRRISHVGTESTFVEGLLLKLGFSHESISVIPSPPPYRQIKAPFSIQSRSGDRGSLRFCYIGQLSAHKGVAELISAFATVHRLAPGSRLLIAGPVSDPWAEALQRRVCEQFDVEDVIFLGHVEDVDGLLRSCDVHVAPTLKSEPYGLVAVEAKQAGRPSIVFAGGGLGELVENGLDGIVVSEKTSKALAEAMLIYCSDPERAQGDGVRARASLTERIGTDRYAERWRAIYDGAVAKC